MERQLEQRRRQGNHRQCRLLAASYGALSVTADGRRSRDDHIFLKGPDGRFSKLESSRSCELFGSSAEEGYSWNADWLHSNGALISSLSFLGRLLLFFIRLRHFHLSQAFYGLTETERVERYWRTAPACWIAWL